MSIREFMHQHWNEGNNIQKIKNSADPVDWNEILQNRGYYFVKYFDQYRLHWYDVAQPWLNENVGEHHYCVTLDGVWFEDQQLALIFALKFI